MYVETYILLAIYGFAALAFILSLYTLLTVREVIRNGRNYSRYLSKRISTLETPSHKQRK